MKGKNLMNLLLSILCVLISVIAYFFLRDKWKWFWVWGSGILALVYFILTFMEEPEEGIEDTIVRNPIKTNRITEVILLSEENTFLARWNLYGKTGMVIGRDIGENQVDINLDHTTYAGMIEVEHAVLNYSGNDWFVEDISIKNGVSIQKSDGKKYKLAAGKPCKLEKGDIIYIALTKLLVS